MKVIRQMMIQDMRKRAQDTASAYGIRGIEVLRITEQSERWRLYQSERAKENPW